MDTDGQGGFPLQDHDGNGLSYKFQRLREQLRSAVTKGELTGKLPGERVLARKFQVNAKTLSKALTDLAAEGLLDRSIGRGTYVKNGDGNGKATTGNLIILCETSRTHLTSVRKLIETNPKAAVISDTAALRPSFLNQFDAVIDAALNTPARLIRELQVRGMTVIALDREPDTYSVDTVAADRVVATNFLTRDLILGGHRHIAVCDSSADRSITIAAEQAMQRYGPEVAISAGTIETVLPAVTGGATAVMCDSPAMAVEVRAVLELAGTRIPRDVSLAAMGVCDAPYPCSGQYVESVSMVQAVTELLGAKSARRPAVIWLAPKWVDMGTTQTVRCTGEAA